MKQIRQGDVLLDPVGGLPAKFKKLEGKILAHGEVTGFNHQLEMQVVDAGDVLLVESEDGKMYVQVKGGDANLVHPEHGPICVKEGVYEVIQQREYDPVKERKVQD